MKWRCAVLATACAAAVGACSPGAAAPPRLESYDLAAATADFRMPVEVEGAVDIGGPSDSAALTQIIPNGDLRVQARMRLDYTQETVPAGEGGGFTLRLRATDLQGRIESFLATRTLGADDLGAFGQDGTISVEVAPDGSVRSTGGSPLGKFDLPVLRDVLTVWPCPSLPPGGAGPEDRWESQVPVGGGTQHLTSHDGYAAVEVDGSRHLDLSARREGTITADDVDLDAVLAVLAGDDEVPARIGSVSVRAVVDLTSRCRLSETGDALDSWSTDGKVDVTLEAAGGGRFDGVLDGTTMSFDVSASSARHQ